MLVLSRRIGEDIVIADTIQVTVVGIRGDRVQLGIVAPRDVPVDRAEVHKRKRERAADPRGALVRDLPAGQEPPTCVVVSEVV